MSNPLQVSFVGGDHGDWAVQRISAITGPGLAAVPRVHVVEGPWPFGVGGQWLLRGVVSHDRYLHRQERDALRAVQPPLGRPEATRAVLIPLSKSPAWWDLAQDERRAILEDRSHHIATGLHYLPAIARRLHHGQERGEEFDFLAWFEFSPSAERDFDQLLGQLRGSEEWRYVEREVEIRLASDQGARQP